MDLAELYLDDLEPLAKTPTPTESGGDEDITTEGPHGDPASWTFRDVLRIATTLVFDEVHFFLATALLAACLSGFLAPGVGGIVSAVLVIGATHLLVVEGARDLELSRVWHRFGVRLLPNLWTSTLAVAGVVAGVLTAAFFLGFLGRWLGAPGVVLGLVPVVLGGVRVLGAFARMVFLLPQVVILEDESGLEALREGFRLVDRRTNLVVGSVLATSLLAGAASAGPTFLLAFLAGFGGLAQLAPVKVVIGLPAALCVEWSTVCVTLFYLRERAEGSSASSRGSRGGRRRCGSR